LEVIYILLFWIILLIIIYFLPISGGAYEQIVNYYLYTYYSRFLKILAETQKDELENISENCPSNISSTNTSKVYLLYKKDPIETMLCLIRGPQICCYYDFKDRVEEKIEVREATTLCEWINRSENLKACLSYWRAWERK